MLAMQRGCGQRSPGMRCYKNNPAEPQTPPRGNTAGLAPQLGGACMGGRTSRAEVGAVRVLEARLVQQLVQAHDLCAVQVPGGHV